MLPDLLTDLSRLYHTACAEERAEPAGLLVEAYRLADAVCELVDDVPVWWPYSPRP